MTTWFLAEVDRYSTDGLTMKPKETFLFLFRFICGSFLNRKQQNMNLFWCGRLKWSWICPRWRFVHDTFTCYKMASKLLDRNENARFQEYLRNCTLAHSRTLDFGDHEWYEIARVHCHCSLKRDFTRSIHEIKVYARTTCKDTTQIDSNLVLGRAPRFAAEIRTGAARSKKDSKISPYTNLK